MAYCSVGGEPHRAHCSLCGRCETGHAWMVVGPTAACHDILLMERSLASVRAAVLAGCGADDFFEGADEARGVREPDLGGDPLQRLLALP